MVLNPQTHTKTHSTPRFHRHVDESSEILTIFLFVHRKHFFCVHEEQKKCFFVGMGKHCQNLREVAWLGNTQTTQRRSKRTSASVSATHASIDLAPHVANT